MNALERIVYVLHIFPKLSETFVAGELAELRRRGVAVRILSLLPPREQMQHEIIRRAGLAEITCYDVARFAEVIRDFKPQLLHAHFATEATAKARELSAQCGVPFTFTAHGYDIHRKPPADFRERALAARAVVTVSEANANHITTQFNFPRERVRVIPCGVDTDEFRPQPSAESEAVPWVVCVARHVPVKNLGLLLEACGLLHGRGVKFRCAMIGDGPEHEALKAKRARLNLESVVEMPGALDQNEVRHWWQRAAVGVLSSENEGMPVCLMEAAACGVPVVAPAVGGIPELVVHGATGLLAKPGDLADFTAKLEQLLLSAQLRSDMGNAARLRAQEQFSVRRQVDRLMEMWAQVLASPQSAASSDSSSIEPPPKRIVSVSDPYDARADAMLPTVAAALNPELAGQELKRHLPRLAGPDAVLRLRAIRVIRHKPAKRCVIEYDVRPKVNGVKHAEQTLIGKIRSRRSGNEGYRQQEAIWNAGFSADSPDGISVPEPVGVLSELKMWCQRKVAGTVATRLLAGPDGAALARRIAEAIHKLHRANLPSEKTHMMADELRILRECFEKVTAQQPVLAGRLARIFLACEALAAQVKPARLCGIHRDFYSSQVIVDGARLWLIDFDCLCIGDPGLDVGNFIGHLVEQALRELGDAAGLRHVEQAMEDRFVELSGEGVRASVRAYTTLTIARHIYLSTLFPERAHTTGRLVEVCERRLMGN